jgi:hypothetical protein
MAGSTQWSKLLTWWSGKKEDIGAKTTEIETADKGQLLYMLILEII